MERVHKPEVRTWIDDEVINVKAFKEQWANSLIFKINSDVYTEPTLLENLIPKEEYAEIEKECGLEAMKCHWQDRVELSSRIVVPENVHLKTLEAQAEEIKRRKNKNYGQGPTFQIRKYRDYPIHQVIGSLKNLEELPFEPVMTPEVVLTVQVYVPDLRVDARTALAPQKTPSFQVDFEFLVLGNQFLTELRDKIECVSDIAIPGELSECPSLKDTVICKDLYKSGYFYINGTFYNDMRDKDCRDYSEVILKWNEKGNRGVGPFKKATMETTKFVDLDIQLGYPYIYIHQGDCEHLLVFSDIRMFDEKNDQENKNAYPVYCVVNPSKRIFCMVCHLYASSWVVYDNPRLPYTRFFFCNSCFKSYNYDKNGQKIGTFSAYYFPDPTKLA